MELFGEYVEDKQALASHPLPLQFAFLSFKEGPVDTATISSAVIISFYYYRFELGFLFERIDLSIAFNFHLYFVGVFDEIRPAERNFCLGLDLERLSILCYLDEVICDIIYIKRMLNFLIIN